MSQPDHRRPLPVTTQIMVGILLAIPFVALLLVGTYAKHGPRLWGFPFFYWYQLLWVFLAAGLTWSAYLLINRVRRTGGK